MKNKYQTIKSVMMIIAFWIVIISVYQCSMIHANPYTNVTESDVTEELSTDDMEEESESEAESNIEETDTSSVEETTLNEMESETESELEETEPTTKSKDAFIVDGNATIVDDISSNGKHFYTLVTENGNVFYLIIDEASDSNNVYFLDTVLEKDLMALAQKHGQILETEPETEEPDVEETQGNLNQGTVEQPQNNPATLSFSSVFVFLLIAGGITIGFWYFATYRPRKSEKEAEDSDDDFEDDEDLEDDDDIEEDDDDEL